MDMTDEQIEKITNLNGFIQYLIDTDEDEWAVDVVRTTENKQNCLFGHLVNYVYGKDYEGKISPAWDMFEAEWLTDFFVYPVNDGKNPDYQQPTPRQRCIQMMKDVWLGKIETTWHAYETFEK